MICARIDLARRSFLRFGRDQGYTILINGLRDPEFEIADLGPAGTIHSGSHDKPSCPDTLYLGRAAAVFNHLDRTNLQLVQYSDLPKASDRTGACRRHGRASREGEGDERGKCFHWTKLPLSLMSAS